MVGDKLELNEYSMMAGFFDREYLDKTRIEKNDDWIDYPSY